MAMAVEHRLDLVLDAVRNIPPLHDQKGCIAPQIVGRLQGSLTERQVYQTLSTLRRRGQVRVVGKHSKRLTYRAIRCSWWHRFCRKIKEWGP